MLTIISLSVLGILILTEGLLKRKSWLLFTILFGLIVVIIMTCFSWNTDKHFFNDMLIVDNYAVAFNMVLLVSTFFIFMFAGHYYREVTRPLDDVYAIMIFALIGGVVMTSYGNLIMLFLGIEIMSISLYILAGSHKEAITSNEATLKYFLLGSFLSTFLLFGIALVYGASGSLNVAEISRYVTTNADHLPPLFMAGMFLMIIGLAFKIAIVPFHFWAPDVYEGTPTLLTAFMATVVKVASIAALYRLFSLAFPAIHGMWEQTLWVMAVLTILIGNLTALYQKGLKRMLAYSSISHSGYMMLAVIAFGANSANALLLYSAAYSVSTITAFGILILIRSSKGNDLYESFKGMGKNNPVEATCLTIALLSLMGIPPLAGFISKYYLFSTAMEKGFLWLMIFALIGSGISVVYYFKPITTIFLREGDGIKMESHASFRWHIVLLTVVTLLLGIVPFWLTNLL